MNFLNPTFWLGALISALVLFGAGFATGHSVASGAAEKREDKAQLAADTKFQEQVALGKKHAAAALEWERKSRTYYLNWQERLKHENDSALSDPALLLSATWLSLYNAAWLPGYDAGDSSGIAYSLIDTGGVTPREVLENVGLNAEACAVDRKRHDKLIDFLTAVPTNRQKEIYP